MPVLAAGRDAGTAAAQPQPAPEAEKAAVEPASGAPSTGQAAPVAQVSVTGSRAIS